MSNEERIAHLESSIGAIRREIDIRIQSLKDASELEQKNRVLRDEKQNEFRGALSDLSERKVDRSTVDQIELRLIEKMQARASQQTLVFAFAFISSLIAVASIVFQIAS